MKRIKYIRNIIFALFIIFAIVFLFDSQIKAIIASLRFSQFATILAPTYDDDDSSLVIKETSNLSDSEDRDYWLNSGALFYIRKNNAHTILGDLPEYSPWRLFYERSNPLDTDDGYHPQNIFRLVTKKVSLDSSQSFAVLIVNDNLNQSPNRNESNGILLMGRYIDSDNLYYAGIRVDGTAVIKKKKDGVYYTLAQTFVFEGDPYHKDINPSLLPKNQWIGLKANIEKINSQAVSIDFYIDKKYDGNWTKVLSVIDSAQTGGGPIVSSGHSGIRSDFMDIEIKDYVVNSLPGN